MTQTLRAEDLQILDWGIDLGGRSVLAGSIVSIQVEKRVSAELLGFAGLIAACVAVAAFSGSPGVAALTLPVAAVLALGARRELSHPYVMVLDIYQAGKFEARGFTLSKAVETLGAVETLRTEQAGSRSSPGGGAGPIADGPLF